MKSMITELYYGNLCGSDVAVPKELNATELKLYDQMSAQLSSKDKLLFDDFIESMLDTVAEEMLSTYLRGFKVGCLLGMELNEKEGDI